MPKHDLYLIVKDRRESQHKDIMLLLTRKKGWIWYNKFAKLWIWPVSTKMSEIRKKIKMYWYTIENKMERTKRKWRKKVNSSFILQKI